MTHQAKHSASAFLFFFPFRGFFSLSLSLHIYIDIYIIIIVTVEPPPLHLHLLLFHEEQDYGRKDNIKSHFCFLNKEKEEHASPGSVCLHKEEPAVCHEQPNPFKPLNTRDHRSLLLLNCLKVEIRSEFVHLVS